MRCSTENQLRPVVGLRLDGDHCEAAAASVSPNHLFVQTDLRPAYGEVLEVVLPSVTSMGEITVEATVRWTTEGGVGLQLDRPGPKAVFTLHRIMELFSFDEPSRETTEEAVAPPVDHSSWVPRQSGFFVKKGVRAEERTEPNEASSEPHGATILRFKKAS